MKKRILAFLNVMLLISLFLTQLTFADSTSVDKTGSANQASNPVFDWKKDDSHLTGDYNSVVYGKGVYVAVGKKGIISVSKDLKKWDSAFKTDNYFGPEPGQGFKTVLFNGDVFVAAGGRAILYSKDGYNWNKVIIESDGRKPEGFTLSYDALINYGMTKGKTFVLTGNGVLACSADGVNWRNQPGISIEHSGMFTIGSIFTNPIYDGNKFATICTDWIDENFNKKYSVYTSNDGLVWEKTETEDLKAYNYGFLSYFEGKYYTSYYNYDSNKNVTIESQNLMDWEDSKDQLDNIHYKLDDAIYKLGDGIYSYKKDKGFTADYKVTGTSTINGVCKGDGKLVAVGTAGLILVCNADKKGQWTSAGSQLYKSIYSAAAGNKCMVAVGKDGQILKSSDGKNWSIIRSNITQSLHSIIFDGKKFIAAGDKGTIAVSSDGDSWEVIPSKTQADFLSIKKINDRYFVSGRSVILSSKDTKNWSLGTAEPIDTFHGERLSSVAYKDGVYYTISFNNSFVYSSSDAVTWKQSYRFKGNDYTDLSFYKGRFIVIGGSMAISKDMKSEVQLQKGGFVDWDEEPCKISVFKDFLLTGIHDGKILFSPDGLVWSNAGLIDSTDCANAFVEYKGKYYGFTSNGMIITGTIKGKIPEDSDITASYLYNYPDTVGNTPRTVSLLKQPIIRNNTILLTPETISKIIGGTYSYDKSKKTVQISMGKRSIKFTANYSYAVVNGRKTVLDQKPQSSGGLLYVPVKAAFNSLGYLYSYDSFYRRIYVTVDETIKSSSISFKPSTFKNNDGDLYFRSVSFNGKTYVAVANGGIICTSKDGINWSRTAEIKGAGLLKVLWNGKRFIAVGGNGDTIDSKSLICVSDDGTKWTKLENVPSIKYICDGAVGGSGRSSDEVYTGSDLKQTVLVAVDGSIMTSEDGLVWEKSLDRKAGNWFYVCWNKGTYYVSGRDNGTVYTSKDGLKWSLLDSKIKINKLIPSGNYLWAVKTYGDVNTDSSKLYRSSDGKNWSFVADVPQKIITDIVYTGKSYVLTGYRPVRYSQRESLGFGMFSKTGDLWDYTCTPKNFEITNDHLCYGNLIILATSKGLFTINEK